MGSVLSECSKVMTLEDLPSDADVKPGPRLVLRIASAPIDEHLGAHVLPFGAGDEVAVVSLEQVQAWEPLRWRFERSARERAQSVSTDRVQRWPDTPRCSLPRRCWRAHVLGADGTGGFFQHYCMLQVIDSKKDRKMENLRLDMEDATDAASHAHRFNMHLARVAGADAATADDLPSVKVAVPVACFVIGGHSTDVAAPGESLLLLPYAAPQVDKFLFDGSQEFQELPQAFFHYTACQTGGAHYVCDIQGAEDDGSFVIVDPMLLRAPKPGISDLMGAAFGKGGAPASGPNEQLFDQLHPRCGALCKAFDPSRKNAHQRRVCGMNTSTCGVGGS